MWWNQLKIQSELSHFLKLSKWCRMNGYIHHFFLWPLFIHIKEKIVFIPILCQWSVQSPGLSSRITATSWWGTNFTYHTAGLTVASMEREQTWPASTARARTSSWRRWSSTGQSGADRRWEYNAAKQGNFLSMLGYLDCRGDKGGERKLQLDGWNPLGLRQLGRRLYI